MQVQWQESSRLRLSQHIDTFIYTYLQYNLYTHLPIIYKCWILISTAKNILKIVSRSIRRVLWVIFSVSLFNACLDNYWYVELNVIECVHNSILIGLDNERLMYLKETMMHTYEWICSSKYVCTHMYNADRLRLNV